MQYYWKCQTPWWQRTSAVLMYLSPFFYNRTPRFFENHSSLFPQPSWFYHQQRGRAHDLWLASLDTYVSQKRPMKFNPRLLHKQLVKKCPLSAKNAKKVRQSLLAVITTTRGQNTYEWCYHGGCGWGMGERNEGKQEKITYSWHYYFSTSRFMMRRLILSVHLCHVFLLSCRPPISSGLPVSSFPGNSLSTWYHFWLTKNRVIFCFCNQEP